MKNLPGFKAAYQGQYISSTTLPARQNCIIFTVLYGSSSLSGKLFVHIDTNIIYDPNGGVPIMETRDIDPLINMTEDKKEVLGNVMNSSRNPYFNNIQIGVVPQNKTTSNQLHTINKKVNQ